MESWPSQSRKETPEEAVAAEAALSDAHREGSTKREGFLSEAIEWGEKAGLTEAEIKDILKSVQFGSHRINNRSSSSKVVDVITFPFKGHTVGILGPSVPSSLDEDLLATGLVSIDGVDIYHQKEKAKKVIEKFGAFFSVLRDINNSSDDATREAIYELYDEAKKRGDEHFKVPSKAYEDRIAKERAAEDTLDQLAA